MNFKKNEYLEKYIANGYAAILNRAEYVKKGISKVYPIQFTFDKKHYDILHPVNQMEGLYCICIRNYVPNLQFTHIGNPKRYFSSREECEGAVKSYVDYLNSEDTRNSKGANKEKVSIEDVLVKIVKVEIADYVQIIG